MQSDSSDYADLIAPCGMNCAVCRSHLALTHDVKHQGIQWRYCPGCRPRGKCWASLKKRCSLLAEGNIRFCYECSTFPCENLKRFDARYQKRYRVSVIENLTMIRDTSVDVFLEREWRKWKCPNCDEIICCHNGIYFSCGLDHLRSKRKVYQWNDE